MDCSGLETHFVKAPADALARNAKATTKLIEAQLKKIGSALDKLKDNPSERAAVVTKLKKQLATLKKKAKSQLELEHRLAKQTLACAQHLQHGLRATSPAEQAAWREVRLQRFLIDHFVRCGHYATASALAAQPALEHCYDLSIFEELTVVEDALRQQDLGPALAWCETHQARLSKKKSTMAVTLRCQQMIELVRQGKHLDAIALARANSDVFEEHPQELQLALGTLVMDEPETHPRYQHFFHPSRWLSLMDQLRRNALSLHGWTGAAPLELALTVGLAALKCEACGNEINPNCPACQTRLRHVAAQLPVGNRAQSVLVCRLTGRVMDDSNPPMMLPNGNVYSAEGLKAMDREQGRIVCPRSQKVYHMVEAKRLYIL
eukprot:m.98222 g.98222  ORF g.98222 m.98222 type:complete len:377 (+) comp15074_c0_seq1:142-1272(+)